MVNARLSRLLAAIAVAAAALASGCKPDIEGRPSLLDSPRVIAVRSTPAETKPSVQGGALVTYEALFAAPSDEAASALDWAYCTRRKPLAVTGPMARECFAPRSPDLVPFGAGLLVEGILPEDGCRVFGPNPPTPKPPEPGEPPEPVSRPADPDPTGGYYQPLRVLTITGAGPEYVAGVTRLSCDVPGLTSEQFQIYATKYRKNENPVFDAVEVIHRGSASEPVPEDEAATIAVKRGETVTFRTTWASCPVESTCGDGICGAGEKPEADSCPADCEPFHGCTGSEPFAAYDAAEHRVVDRREAMRVSWFATDGDFEHDRTGRPEEDAERANTENDWIAPEGSGEVRVWIVIRDDRGGVGWRTFRVAVGG